MITFRHQKTRIIYIACHFLMYILHNLTESAHIYRLLYILATLIFLFDLAASPNPTFIDKLAFIPFEIVEFN
jgi:hypothetical protein